MDQWKVSPLCCCCPFSTLLGFSARKCCIVEKKSCKIHMKIPAPKFFFLKSCWLWLWICNFIIKENLAQVFSCEFCKSSKNAFCYRTPLVAGSSCHLYCNSKYYHSSSEVYLEPCQISMIEHF